MARLIVVQITVSGFIRYSETAPGVLTLGGAGPVALVGDNGVGKSSIASKALSWCFYGKCAPERMGAGTRALKGKSVVAEGCKTATVSIELRDIDGGGYIVERYRTRTRAESIAVVRIEPNGSRAPVPGADQTTIEGILGCDYSVFCATVLRGQGDPWNFAEATDGKKREILAAVSGADKLTEPYKAARDLAAQLSRDATGLRQRSDDARRRADRVDLASMERQTREWDGQQAARITQAEREVAHLEAQEAAARVADEAAARSGQARADHAARRPVLDLTPYDEALRRTQEAVQAAVAARASCQAAVDATGGLEPGHECPTCGTTIDASTPVAQRRAAAAIPLAEAVRVHADADRLHTQALEARDGAVAWLEAQRLLWERSGQDIPRGGGDRLPAAQTATSIARRRLEDLRSGDNPHIAMLTRATLDRADMLRECAQLEAAAMLMERDCRLARLAADTLSPKGAAAYMADEVLATIEANANRWLDTLSGGTLTVEFRVDSGRETIQTVITTTDTPRGGGHAERDLLTFSGGERARVNLAVDLGVAAAFSATDGLPLSLLVLDEGAFSGVDSRGKTAIVQTLLSAGVSDIVVIDHDPAARGRLQREVVVARRGDGYAEVTTCPS